MALKEFLGNQEYSDHFFEYVSVTLKALADNSFLLF